jgi:hypothetical protein
MQRRFLTDVISNKNNRAILDRWDALALPDGWLVAGCLFQTVWNLKSGRSPEADIKDYDLFYFDASDLTEESEKRMQAHAEEVLLDLDITVEVCNQARVHLWYENTLVIPTMRWIVPAMVSTDFSFHPLAWVSVRERSTYRMACLCSTRACW